VSPDATQVLTTVMGYVKYCREPFPMANFSPTVPIRRDGTFAIRERFTQRFTDAVERSRLRIEGRFTAGGVTGTFRVRSVARRPRSGRVFDRCDTGTRRFTAVV
jgi:hypothetical protein